MYVYDAQKVNEYKCRAKRVDTGDWVYGFYVVLDNTHYILTGEYDEYPIPVRYEIKPETLGRFTGWLDADSEPIHEDDYLNVEGNDVEYSSQSSGFNVAGDRPLDWYMVCHGTKNVHVIGNRWDGVSNDEN